MQTLNCATCDTQPLDTPRLTNGKWYAQCPGCLTQNSLEPDSSNVFLPVKFRVLQGAAAPRRATRSDDSTQASP